MMLGTIYANGGAAQGTGGKNAPNQFICRKNSWSTSLSPGSIIWYHHMTVSIVLQLRLVPGWGPKNWRSAPLYDLLAPEGLFHLFVCVIIPGSPW